MPHNQFPSTSDLATGKRSQTLRMSLVVLWRGGLAPGASPAVTNSGPVRIGRSSRRHRDAAEDSIRLIRKARSIEERSRGLIRVTIAEHQ